MSAGGDSPARRRVDLGLARMRRLLAALHRPEQHIPWIVHLIGTNGKGSTAAMLAALLQHLGLRVALYTSPPLESRREMFRCDGACIAPADYRRLRRQVLAVCRRLEQAAPEAGAVTEFEWQTALMLLWSVEQRADVLVLEAGLGGSRDATNALLRTDLTIFTSIDLDHRAWLGDTLAAVAREKAGAIRAGVPVLVPAALPPVAAAEIVKAAGERRAPIVRVAAADVAVRETGTAFRLDGPRLRGRFRTPLRGVQQATNAALAVTAAAMTLERLPRPAGEAGAPACAAIAAGGQRRPSPEALPRLLQEGLEQTVWPGRQEWVRGREGKPDVLLDIAHNPESMRALVATLNRDARFAVLPPIFVVGMLADKAVSDCVATWRALERPPALIVAVTPRSPRALPAADFLRMLAKVRPFAGRPGALPAPQVLACDSPWQGLQAALAFCERFAQHTRQDANGERPAPGGDTPLLCVFGSTYVVGPVRKRLRREGWPLNPIC